MKTALFTLHKPSADAIEIGSSTSSILSSQTAQNLLWLLLFTSLMHLTQDRTLFHCHQRNLHWLNLLKRYVTMGLTLCQSAPVILHNALATMFAISEGDKRKNTNGVDNNDRIFLVLALLITNASVTTGSCRHLLAKTRKFWDGQRTLCLQQKTKDRGIPGCKHR